MVKRVANNRHDETYPSPLGFQVSRKNELYFYSYLIGVRAYEQILNHELDKEPDWKRIMLNNWGPRYSYNIFSCKEQIIRFLLCNLSPERFEGIDYKKFPDVLKFTEKLMLSERITYLTWIALFSLRVRLRPCKNFENNIELQLENYLKIHKFGLTHKQRIHKIKMALCLLEGITRDKRKIVEVFFSSDSDKTNIIHNSAAESLIQLFSNYCTVEKQIKRLKEIEEEESEWMINAAKDTLDIFDGNKEYDIPPSHQERKLYIQALFDLKFKGYDISENLDLDPKIASHRNIKGMHDANIRLLIRDFNKKWTQKKAQLKILKDRPFNSKIDKSVYDLYCQLKTVYGLNKKEALARIVRECYLKRINNYSQNTGLIPEELDYTLVPQMVSLCEQSTAVMSTRIDDNVYQMFCELKKCYGLNKRKTLEKLVIDSCQFPLRPDQ